MSQSQHRKGCQESVKLKARSSSGRGPSPGSKNLCWKGSRCRQDVNLQKESDRGGSKRRFGRDNAVYWQHKGPKSVEI